MKTTPCQELGYKVGDKFEVVCDDEVFSKGEIVTLIEDQGDTAPYFEGEAGRCSWLDIPDDVKPLKPKKAKRPWIKWEGGECPVPEGTLIDVKYRDGHKQKGCPAGQWAEGFKYATYSWRKFGGVSSIIAYRLAKPKKAAEPAPEAQAEPTVQREANGRPAGAKEGDWFRVIEEGTARPYRIGDIVRFCTDDKSECPFFLLNGLVTCIHWDRLEPCPAPSQPEPEPAKPEWEILWGSEADFEGAPDWVVYVSPAGSFLEDVIRGARLSYGDGVEDTVQWVANCRPKAARRLKQPK